MGALHDAGLDKRVDVELNYYPAKGWYIEGPNSVCVHLAAASDNAIYLIRQNMYQDTIQKLNESVNKKPIKTKVIDYLVAGFRKFFEVKKEQ